MSTALTSITGVNSATQALDAALTNATPQAAPTSFTDFGVSAAGTAAALGLSQPRNVQDLELVFAQAAAELDATRSENGDLKAAADMSRVAGAIAGANPNETPGDFFSLFVNLVVSIFRFLSGDTGQGEDGSTASQTPALQTQIDDAAAAPVETDRRILDRELSRDTGLGEEIRSGQPTEAEQREPVVNRSAAFVAAVGLVAANLEMVLQTAAPQNAGAMGPAAQDDGRLRLAV